MLPEVTGPTATDIQTIRPHGTNANQDDPANDVLIPDAANTIPLDATQSGSQTRIADEHQNWFASVHNCWMGHRGSAATLDLLQQRNLVWDTMKQDVRTLILRCPVCQKLSVRRLDYHTHPFTTSTYQPHSRINIDTLVLNQPDKQGNIALIVVIDTFTRWIELYPITDFTEEVAALKILEHFGRYGPPTEILTDRGAQFVNKLVKILCGTYGTKFSKTPIAHSHESNAKVENANKQILQSLRAFIYEERVMNDWSRSIPAIQYIFNTTNHRDIGYSSAELLFGPANNLNQFVTDEKPTTALETVAWWDQQLGIHHEILSKAAELQRSVDEKRLVSRAGIPTTYAIDSYVLVEYPKTMGDGRGRPLNKLQTTRKGPMKVIGIDKDAYELLDLVARKVDTVHVARLHPFLYDPEVIDPENVAIRDQGEFIVEEIVDALMDQTLPKTQWSFRVRWQGYDDSCDEWLDWNQLKHVAALHTYLRKNNLAKFIPKSGQLLEDKPLRKKLVVKKDTVVAEVETPTKRAGKSGRIRKNR
jgi:transposase InsO family protein